jgi:Domain of unknown function (DUF3597)
MMLATISSQEESMSIFGNIMGSIFGHAKAATPAPGTHAPGAAPPAGGAKPATGGPATASTGPAGAPVDVEAILTHLATQNHEKLDWRKSIVDLMKLLNLDSSLHARKELAKELHFTGDMNDSASMNIWLHKQVMTKLAESGGVIPESLKHA